MNQYYRLLSNFRLVECASAFLIIMLLNVMCIPVYKVFLANTYALNQAYATVDVRMNLAIDSAYTGNADGVKDYTYLNSEGFYVERIAISPQGHISATANFIDEYIHTPNFVKKEFNGKTFVLHKNVNAQQGYEFWSWRCLGSQNEQPFRVIDPTPEGTLKAKYTQLFCGDK